MTKLNASTEKVANYCTFCPKMCKFSCPVAKAEARETVSPWGLMNLLKATAEGTIDLDPSTAETLYHCADCLRCQEWCRHSNDLPEALVEARRMVVESGVAIPAPLQAADMLMDAHGCVQGRVDPLPDEALDVFSPDADVLFFPACARRAQDGASVVRAGRVIRALLGEEVNTMEAIGDQAVHCCGDALRRTGYTLRGAEWQAKVAAAASQYRVIVTDCAHFVQYLSDKLDSSQSTCLHLNDVMAQHTEKLQALPDGAFASPFLHDACTTGRRLKALDAPRAVLQALFGEDVHELWQHGAQAPCCGGQGVYPTIDPEGARQAAADVREVFADHQARRVVTTDGTCSRHLNGTSSRRCDEIAVVELLDLVAVSLGLDDVSTLNP